jgi:hypothetical protein
MNALSPEIMSDEYDVKSYTEAQLLQILNLQNPSDRELEAQILFMIKKYKNVGNPSGDKLATFFSGVYDYFFESESSASESEDDVQEGFDVAVPDSYNLGNVSATGIPGIVPRGDVLNGTANLPPAIATGNLSTANVGNKPKDVQLTKPLDFSRDNLNPLLKQTIKRIISIDSQYRDNRTNTSSTNFTFNLSEPLKDVVSLSLYSIQIPYVWYTVNSDFGGNFFYLKGNAPGIDNGNHDYMISIAPGNYTAANLIGDVNTSISSLKNAYTDVDFGNSRATYATASCIASLEFYINKIFNEGCYYLDYSTNWSSPSSTTDTNGDLISYRDNTIGGYLGFNAPTQSCSAVYSTYFSYLSTSNSAVSQSFRECVVGPTNGTFRIFPYVGNGYNTATTKYDAITITIPAGNYSQISLVNTLNTLLSSNSQLDPNYSYCTWVDVLGNDSYGIPLYKSGFSYIKIACRLNPYAMPVIRSGLKLAAIFPKTADSIFVDSALNNNSSHFKITYFDKPDNYDSSGNVVSEFNSLLSDTTILQSVYSLSGTTQIRYICNATGYVNPLNNYYINIPPSTGGGITLLEYVDKIKTAISTYTNGNNQTLNKTETSFDLSSNGRLYLKSSFRTAFDTTLYKIRATGQIATIFDISNDFVNLNTVAGYEFSNPEYKPKAISFTPLDTIVISPIAGYGNSGAGDFVITFDGRFSNTGSLEDYIQNQISNFTDGGNRRPLLNSTVLYSPGTGFKLSVNIQIVLNQRDYLLVLYSDPTTPPSSTINTNPNADATTNTWSTDLKFDLSYNLSVSSGYVSLNDNNATVVNKLAISDNQLTITEENNTFYLTPYPTIDGLQTSNNLYRIPVVVPDGTYSITGLLNAMNNALSLNPLSVGTTIGLITFNGNSYVNIRFNINKAFTTEDYKVVFYDPFSFVKCYSGAKQKGSSSVQNATWDSTLGWIMGFQEDTEYILGPTSGERNTFTMRGATGVNTNLYNYFLIMLDDYVQNHLNDGLITITNQETNIPHEPYKYVCNPITGLKTAVPIDYGDSGVQYSDKDLYAFNQRVMSDKSREKTYSSGPFVRDIFGIIPVKTNGVPGSVYVEFGGTLQNQQRLYFGPVNIHRMTIKLLNDRGNLVDLINTNWSFSLVCEQLYKNGY